MLKIRSMSSLCKMVWVQIWRLGKKTIRRLKVRIYWFKLPKSMYPEHMNLCLMKIYGCMASEESKGNLFEFIAYIVACRKSHVSRVARHQRVLFHPSLRLQKREIHACTSRSSAWDWSESCMLQLREKARFHRVCMPCSLMYCLLQQHFVFFFVK